MLGISSTLAQKEKKHKSGRFNLRRAARQVATKVDNRNVERVYSRRISPMRQDRHDTKHDGDAVRNVRNKTPPTSSKEVPSITIALGEAGVDGTFAISAGAMNDKRSRKRQVVNLKSNDINKQPLSGLEPVAPGNGNSCHVQMKAFSPVPSTSSPAVLLDRSQATSLRSRAVDSKSSRIKPKGSSLAPRADVSRLRALLKHTNSVPPVPKSPRLVDCLTCGADDIAIKKSAKLTCGHRMCHDCLKRVFELSVKDPAHMPPKCCTERHIPLHHVDMLFDEKFKMRWNRKHQEYHTRNRIYCPLPACGKWIKPSHISSKEGHKFARCPNCTTKVCVICNNKMHKSRDCSKDPDVAKLVDQMKEKGWQRCYSCHAMVELIEGCNHMVCRCTAEFCMICGSKWKTCECLWFNHTRARNGDHLNEMRVPAPLHRVYDIFQGMAQPAQPPARTGVRWIREQGARPPQE